jgi:hypothetical protein
MGRESRHPHGVEIFPPCGVEIFPPCSELNSSTHEGK